MLPWLPVLIAYTREKNKGSPPPAAEECSSLRAPKWRGHIHLQSNGIVDRKHLPAGNLKDPIGDPPSRRLMGYGDGRGLTPKRAERVTDLRFGPMLDEV